jgi:hypothetical protein
MKCKVRMTYAIEFFVEGKSEDIIQDWMSNKTPEEVRELIEDVEYEDYTEEIICPIADDSIVDYVIEDE